MQRSIFAKILLMTSSALLATQVLAATPRYSTVVSSLYSFNHPYAVQASNELATKMTKMAVSPFSFYRGTSHLFYQDCRKISPLQGEDVRQWHESPPSRGLPSATHRVRP